MNCANHTDVPAVAYCRTCGKPMCASCKRDVRGVIYCEECIASRLGDTMPSGTGAVPSGSTVVPGTGPAVVIAPPSGGASPALAAMLGFIPGVGAMYNGQFVKGLIHVGIFATLVYGADHAGEADVFFGFGIAFWIFYMVFDAYKTAHARMLGQAPPDPFGFDRLWGTAPPPPTAAANVAPGEVPPGAVYSEADMPQRPPVGAIIMIVIGVLFLLNTLDIMRLHWIGRFWPVFLIVLGVWTWMKRNPGAAGRE